MIAKTQEPQEARGASSAPALFCLQHEDPVPVGRRRVFLEYADAFGIDVEKVAQTEAIPELAAAFNRLRCTGKVLLAKAREHVVDVLTQLAEPIAVYNVRAAKNGIDRLRFGLAFDSNAVELQHRELVADCRRRARSENDRQAIILRLSFQPGSQIYGIAEDGIVEPQIRAHVSHDATAGIDADAHLDRDEALAAFFACCSRWPLSVSTRRSISSAASQALISWLASFSGAFQNAITASPMYLSMVPLCSMMALVSGVRKLFINDVRPCGSSLYSSDMVVNPRTSLKRMLISRSSPPSTSLSGDCASCSTSAGERYWPKAERMRRRCASSLM